LHNGISTRSAKAGDPVYLETLFPIMVDGKVVIPAGSYVSGEVTEAKRPGRVKGRAEIMLRLDSLILPNAYQVSFIGTPGNAGTGGNESVDKEGKVSGDTDKAADAATIAKTTAVGAGIGGVAGGPKGLGIGAGIGAATGLAAVLLSRGPEAELPRGTTLEAVLDRPLFLDSDRLQFTSPGQASTLAGPPNREPQRTRSFPY
jgi:type IV secretion system protein VirB10